MAFRFRARPAIGDWTLEQVGDFLEAIGLGDEHKRRFFDEGMNGRLLCQATDSDFALEPFKLPYGPRKTLLREIEAQLCYARAREKHNDAGPSVVLTKGATRAGPQISADALERIRNWVLDPATGYRALKRRSPPLTDEELECWQYQADWLVCPVTGKAWARGDVVSTMGVALYHAPRFCSEREKQRRPLEEEQARRSDAARKAGMDHTGTTFERDFEIYPAVEPPPLVNLPDASACFEPPSRNRSAGDTERLQRLKTEASGLKSRSAAVQQQMFQGLGADTGSNDAKFMGTEDVQIALDQLKREPTDDIDLAHKFGLYESYFSGVDGLRKDLFEFWERGRSMLAPKDAARMTSAIRGIDSFDNLSIPERSRFWFVYHMMSKASENHGKLERVLNDLEEVFDAACDVPVDAVTSGGDAFNEDPPLGYMEVVIGPAFDIDAYNDGINGNPGIGILPAADRGVLDMDRQYNAVNFQFFVQRTAAGVTREGAEVSFERKLCTSRLSFYLEESHGSRVFPKNILSQLSLLFYRRNDALRLADGKVNERRVAVCVRKAIPRLLRAITVDIFHGDASHVARVEEGVRLYLAVHQVAIKLLATFQTSYELLFRSIVEWVQQPFCSKSDREWPDLEELLLGASLCSMPWPLLREAFVRKLIVQLLKNTTQMSTKATARQRAEHLFLNNRALLGRLAYILAFFAAGPGKLPVGEMDKKYARCAGTLPKEDRDALVSAATEGAGASSFVELWGGLGMRRTQDVDDDAVLRHIVEFLSYVQANEAAWRVAAPPIESSEGPALPASALEQLAQIGAEICGANARAVGPPQSRRERELAQAQQRAAERAQHQGYPKLPPSRRLDGTLCYYCFRRFPSRMALFSHLRRTIDKERFFEGHHQHHFDLRVAGGPAGLQNGPCRCMAESCGKEFLGVIELRKHYHEMGVPGFEEEVAPEKGPAATPEPEGKAEHLREELGGADAALPVADLATCSVCMDRPPNVVMVPCGHYFACEECGQALTDCAICRSEVTQVLRVYYS